MLFDWFTLLAQIVNFLILVFLLKRFLFKPVLKAIDERERKIASSIKDAAVKMQDANKTRDLYQEKLEDLERQRAERMQELAEQVEQEREKKLARIKSEVEHESERLRHTLQTEADEFAQGFRRLLGHAVMDALEKTLQDLSGQSLEQRMIERFADKLAEEGPQVWQTPESQGTENPSETVRIVSTWALPLQQQKMLESVIQSQWPGLGTIEYETDPAKICGLSLHWGSLQLNWHVDDYLASLHDCLDSLVTLPEAQSTEQGASDDKT